MILLQNLNITECLYILAILSTTFFILFIGLMISHRIFIKKIKKNITTKLQTKTLNNTSIHITLKSLCVILAVLLVLSSIDLITVYFALNKAKYHGMVKDVTSNSYNLTLGQIIKHNKRSLTESKIDTDNFDTLKGKIIIIYRYDCSDCLDLYDELKDLKNVIYLSSRTKTGLAFRDYFNPNLLKVPSGIYIRQDGKPVTLELYYNNDDIQKVIFDYDNWNRLLNIQKQDLNLDSSTYKEKS